MEFSVVPQGHLLLVHITGRLDAFGSQQFQKELDPQIDPSITNIILEMSGVDYLSSAALRVFLGLFRRLKPMGGTLALAGVKPYCRQVLEIAGFSEAFPLFDSAEQALCFCQELSDETSSLEHWDDLEVVELPCGTLRIIPGSDDPGAVEVLGHIENVLYSRVTPNHLCSKRFSEAEYSIGLGGLGDRLEDYFGIMGEMLTIGGTMVWLPTDGHDMPDFLIPKTDTGAVTLRTGFNVSIAGRFNETMIFESREANGTSLDTLYRQLFDLSKTRRSDFKGVLGLAARAQMTTVYGSGILKSPVSDKAPANGEMVISASNSQEWFDFDVDPRHTHVTGLLCGIGADLTTDLSSYDPEELSSVFYLNPANTGSKDQLLHNHGVFFEPIPIAPKTINLEKEIRAVVEDGIFVDMRHLLDRSTFTQALLGISYIQSFRRDPRGQAGYGGLDS